LCAVIALRFLFVALRSRAATVLSGVVDPGALVFLSMPSILLLLLGGMAIGCLGGFMAAWSAREVAD
jgi:hypothetical protein